MSENNLQWVSVEKAAWEIGYSEKRIRELAAQKAIMARKFTACGAWRIALHQGAPVPLGCRSERPRMRKQKK